MRKLIRKFVEYDAADSAASPMLVCVTVTLSAILAICEADLHRDLLGQVSIAMSNRGLGTPFVGP
jgi:hypothetical protein